jgi:hypothetical protein
MSGVPTIGRRGFRDWYEVLADLAAIATASSPHARARIWMYDPSVGGVAPTGAFAVEASDDHAILQIDGTEVAFLDRATFRGGWLSRSDDTYYLDVDVGQRDHIQISWPGAPRRG